VGAVRDPVPLEYSIQWLTCTVADKLDTVRGRLHDAGDEF
jgi:hypothetical protein